MRLADDFLLVTKSATVAARFYDIMTRGIIYILHISIMSMTNVTQGIPEYNCFINVNKTVKNFEIAEGREAKITTDGIALLVCMYVCTEFKIRNENIHGEMIKYFLKSVWPFIKVIGC